MNPDFSESAEFYKKHLRPFSMDSDSVLADFSFTKCFAELSAAFHQTIRYHLTWVKTDSNVPQKTLVKIPVTVENKTLGYLCLSHLADLAPLLDINTAARLTKSAARILEGFYRSQRAIFHYQTELTLNDAAASFDGPPAASSLTDRLSVLLKKGGELIDCEAASLYLLNSETTLLNLRALWGLPSERFQDPPRLLSRAFADLECLLGNAVILNEPYLINEWNAPESYNASACIPIISENVILGTIWFFSNKKKDFTVKDISLLEIIAGQIAAELELNVIRQKIYSDHSAQSTAHPKNHAPKKTQKIQTPSPSGMKSPQGLFLPKTPLPASFTESTLEDKKDKIVFHSSSKELSPLDDSIQPTSSKEPSAAEVAHFINLLEEHLDKKGKNCKNLTLFISKKRSQDSK